MGSEKIICDTDVMIDLWNEKNQRHFPTKNAISDKLDSDILISAITKMELLLGALNKSDKAKIKKQMAHFTILLISPEISNLAIDLVEQYSLSHGLAIPDSLIAATSLVNDIPLFTYNIKDYKFIKGLKLFDSN